MINLDQKIKVCPTCKGWGYPQDNQNETCSECFGEGVYIQSGEKRKAFGLPFFIDMDTRQKAKVMKTILLTGLILIIVLILLIVIFS